MGIQIVHNQYDFLRQGKVGHGRKTLFTKQPGEKTRSLFPCATTILCIRRSLEKRIPLPTKRKHHVLNDKWFLSIFCVSFFPVTTSLPVIRDLYAKLLSEYTVFISKG
jgi:hypothetical protein